MKSVESQLLSQLLQLLCTPRALQGYHYFDCKLEFRTELMSYFLVDNGGEKKLQMQKCKLG